MIRTGILSDRSIRSKYYDANTLPIPVSKYSSVVKPGTSSIVSSIKNPRSFDAPPRIIPRIVAENAKVSGGRAGLVQQQQIINDITQKVKAGNKDYGVLLGKPRNRGSLMQDLQVQNIPSMKQHLPRSLAAPKKMDTGIINRSTQEPIDRILARMSGPPQYNETTALAGAVLQIEMNKDPTLKSQVLLSTIPNGRQDNNSEFFLRNRVKTQARGQPNDGQAGTITPLTDSRMPEIQQGGQGTKMAGPPTTQNPNAQQPTSMYG